MADYDIPIDLRYSTEDEWARRDDGYVTLGITDYAQQQLGDICFVELPDVGDSIQRGDSFGVIESVKAVSDLYAPVSGTVKAVNADLTDSPEVVNEDCYGSGWMISIQIEHDEEYDSLLDARAYRKHVDERSE